MTLFDIQTSGLPPVGPGDGALAGAGEGEAPNPASVAVFSVVVLGTPAPQGSKSGFINPRSGRVQMKESSSKVKPWRQDVMQAARDVVDAGPGPWLPLDGPLAVRMVFTLRKPVSAPKRRRTWPDRTPDLSKLARSTEDALTSVGVWVDDARVVDYDRLAKVFPGEDPEALDVPGCRIQIRRVIA